MWPAAACRMVSCSLVVAALVQATAVATLPKADLACSLNGAAVGAGGKCVCDKPWKGDTCSVSPRNSSFVLFHNLRVIYSVFLLR